MKEWLHVFWNTSNQDLNDKAIGQWLKRVTAVVWMQAGHIEHQLE